MIIILIYYSDIDTLGDVLASFVSLCQRFSSVLPFWNTLKNYHKKKKKKKKRKKSKNDWSTLYTQGCIQ